MLTSFERSEIWDHDKFRGRRYFTLLLLVSSASMSGGGRRFRVLHGLLIMREFAALLIRKRFLSVVLSARPVILGFAALRAVPE